MPISNENSDLLVLFAKKKARALYSEFLDKAKQSIGYGQATNKAISQESRKQKMDFPETKAVDPIGLYQCTPENTCLTDYEIDAKYSLRG